MKSRVRIVEPWLALKESPQTNEGGDSPHSIVGTGRRRWIPFLRLLRLHHRIKNVLVFVPALAGHRLPDYQVAIACGHAFAAFCICASGIYVFNDTLDYRADRLHPRKRHRPIAAGEVSPAMGWTVSTLLLLFAIIIALGLSVSVAAWLTTYIVLNLSYSLYIKRTVIADIVVLTGFYLLRLMVGGAAAEIPISPWLMAFCFAAFFSLSACKRYAEIFTLSDGQSLRQRGRGYHAEDSQTIHMIGVAAAFSAVLVLGLYIDSPTARQLYRSPQLLWLCCPLILYWLLRLWIVAGRGRLVDDPLVAAVRDWRGWVVAIVTTALFMIAL